MFFKDIASAIIRGTITTKLLFPKLFKKKKDDDDQEELKKTTIQYENTENTENKEAFESPVQKFLIKREHKPISFYITKIELPNETNQIPLHETISHETTFHTTFHETTTDQPEPKLDSQLLFTNESDQSFEHIVDEKDYHLYGIPPIQQPPKQQEQQNEKICFQPPFENQVLCQVVHCSSSYPFVLFTITNENFYILMTQCSCNFYLTCSHSGPIFINENQITFQEQSIELSQNGKYCIGNIQLFDDTREYHYELLSICQ